MNRAQRAWRILVADPNPMFRVGLRLLMEVTTELRLAGEFRSSWVNPARLRRPDWDLLLVDPDGAEGRLPAMRKAAGRRRILAISDRVDAAFVIGALQAGAHGFVSKRVSPAELLEAILETATPSDGKIAGCDPSS